MTPPGSHAAGGFLLFEAALSRLRGNSGLTKQRTADSLTVAFSTIERR